MFVLKGSLTNQLKQKISKAKDALQVGQKTSSCKPEKKHKFNAKSIRIDGVFYPSLAEAKRHQELILLERAGEIYGLLFQKITFDLVVNGVLITSYRPDFVYYQKGVRVIEDKKGYRTDEYMIKRSLMLAIYGIEILET